MQEALNDFFMFQLGTSEGKAKGRTGTMHKGNLCITVSHEYLIKEGSGKGFVAKIGWHDAKGRFMSFQCSA